MRPSKRARIATLVAYLGLQFVGTAVADEFVVENAHDAGAGSLRQAILNANAMAGADLISFNVPGNGPHKIQPISGLPTITGPVVIDGYTQPGSSPNSLKVGINAQIRIELDGSLLASSYRGLTITADDVAVKGLVINNFPSDGIRIYGNRCTITGNYIGTNVLGTAPAGNGGAGVIILNASENVIGGVALEERNLLSGNSGDGVNITGDQSVSNVVLGNYIGTDISGTIALPNADGVQVGTAIDNSVGGVAPGAGNLISGNNGFGVSIGEAITIYTTGTSVQGNYIGTDASGTSALGNQNYGIAIGRGDHNCIGGTRSDVPEAPCGAPFAGNLISANVAGAIRVRSASNFNAIQGNFIGTDASGLISLANGAGINISASSSYNTIGGNTVEARNVISGNNGSALILTTSSNGNQVYGNYIGLDATGASGLGNESGIIVSGGSQNRIGGLGDGEGNAIAFNGQFGISMISGVGNSVRGNSIRSNALLGIDLRGGNEDPITRVTSNDPGDADAGVNNLQNYPDLISVLVDPSDATTSISGSLASTPNANFSIDVYDNQTCDQSGFGEGGSLLATTNASTDNNGDAVFFVLIPSAVTVGHAVTAVATDALGNSSEFSACVDASEVSDLDEDGILDDEDNCTLTQNAEQRDTDQDGIGNFCDADFNNDCIINFLDLGLFVQGFLGTDPNLDLNGDGNVNFVDIGIVKSLFFQQPGPSGVPNVCQGQADVMD